MTAPTAASRTLRFFLFLSCAGAIAGGIWYAQGGRLWQDEQDLADEDEDPIDLKADAGLARRHAKKGAAHPKKKGSDARQARASAVHPVQAPTPSGPSGMSYEAAIAGNNLKLAPGTTDVPDLTDAELAGPMRDGTFLDACGVPSSTHVTVKVAIRNGHAVGVSVTTAPSNREMAWCVERQVRGVQWPSNAKMDSFTTTY